MRIYRCLVFFFLSFMNNEARFLHKNHLQTSSKAKTRHSTRWKINSNISEELHGKKKILAVKKDAKLRENRKDKLKKSSSRGGRKSTIDINEKLAQTPVMYNSPDGHDYYVYVKTKSPQRTVQHAVPAFTMPPSSVAISNTSHIPSRTFLVTVFGKHLDGAEEKIREALADAPHTTEQPCHCPCCQCACQSPDMLNDADCSCDKPSHCPCEEAHNNDNRNSGAMMMFVPMNGAQMRQHQSSGACACPCCMCSCSKPGYENYNCGCQQWPPVPCPCNPSSSTSVAQPTPSPNCQCPALSGTPCTCTNQQASINNYCACANQPNIPACPCANNPPNSLQVKTNVAPDHGLFPTPSSQTYHVGPYDIQSECQCYCCPCTCPVSFSSENPPCSCTSAETQPSCPCKRTHV